MNTKILRYFEFAGRKVTWKLRQEPAFLIIGAQKAGTTSLQRYLEEHPAIEPTFRKEVHFFDTNYHKGKDWYLAHFGLRNGEKQAAAAGEATPSYLFHPEVPERAFKFNPHFKLIVLLRNPIDRTYSHYHHEVKKGREARPFEEVIQTEPEEFQLGGSKQKERINTHCNAYTKSYLARSRYAEQLERWLAVFPKEQLIVFQSEEFYSKPGECVHQVLEFLGLPPFSRETYKPFNQNSYTKMDEETRKSLAKYFEPHNARLFQLIGKTYNWEN